jgi:hypothetical protein
VAHRLTAAAVALALGCPIAAFDAVAVPAQPTGCVHRVQVLIDNGVGLPRGSLADLRNGVTDLINVLPAGTEVTLVATAPQPRFIERGTDDRARLTESLGRIVPETTAGQFVESIGEALDRAAKDAERRHALIAVGTSVSGTSFRDRDVQRIFERVQQLKPVVFVTVLNQVRSQNAIAASLGEPLARVSGGRFAALAVSSRLVTLLPEMARNILGC